MNRILIIQTAFLGDVILALPVASELRRIFPSAQIDFLVKKGNESLLENHSALNTVFTFDKRTGKYREMLRLIRQFRQSRYDLVINLHRFGSSGVMTALSGGKRKYGFKKNPLSFTYTRSFEHEIGNGKHEVARNLSLVQEFGAVQLRRPELFPSSAHRARIEPFLGTPFFCLAPASVWFTKQLPKEKWIELIQRKATQGRIFLLGGKEDMLLCEEIRLAAGVENCQNLAGQLNLLESAALLSKAIRTYVNDSGPLHLASSMNAPVTAFFCSTTPDFGFGPLSEDSQLIQTPENLSCRPCGLHGYKACPERHFNCGHGIEIPQ